MILPESADWKQLRQIVALQSRKVSELHDTKLFLPDSDGPDDLELFLRFPKILGKNLTPQTPLDFVQRRIIGNRIERSIDISQSATVLSEMLSTDTANSAIVLVNGNCEISSAGSSFVYCDGDLTCDYITKSLVISRGRVKFKEPKNSIVIELARKSSSVRLFSAERVGLKLDSMSKYALVQSVAKGSAAERCGLRAGDVLEIDAGSSHPVDAVEGNLRRAYVSTRDIELRVKRSGESFQTRLNLEE